MSTHLILSTLGCGTVALLGALAAAKSRAGQAHGEDDWWPVEIRAAAGEMPEDLAGRGWQSRVDAPTVPQLAPLTARPYLPATPAVARPYRARHRPDLTMRWMPAGWTPPVGARRIAATLDTTQQMGPLT